MGTPSHGAGGRSVWRRAGGLVALLVASYLGFAATVLTIVALTDVGGFAGSGSSIKTLAALVIGAAALGSVGAHLWHPRAHR